LVIDNKDKEGAAAWAALHDEQAYVLL